jgi:hypothetical protein
MPDDYNVQIDPDGDAMTIEELASAVIDMLPDYNGEAEDV